MKRQDALPFVHKHFSELSYVFSESSGDISSRWLWLQTREKLSRLPPCDHWICYDLLCAWTHCRTLTVTAWGICGPHHRSDLPKDDFDRV
jgi:hypothetical protein